MANYLLMLMMAMTVAAADDWAYDKYTLENLPAETCIGKIIRPGMAGAEGDQYSAWVQDPVNKKLRLDIGHPGEPYFIQAFFFENSSYAVVTPGDDKDNVVCVPEATNFDGVFGVYIYPYVRYMADGFWHDKPVRFFAGLSPDPLTHTSISNIAIVSLKQEFVGMAALSTSGYIYYDYPNVTIGTPEAHWYELPEACTK